MKTLTYLCLLLLPISLIFSNCRDNIPEEEVTETVRDEFKPEEEKLIKVNSDLERRIQELKLELLDAKKDSFALARELQEKIRLLEDVQMDAREFLSTLPDYNGLSDNDVNLMKIKVNEWFTSKGLETIDGVPTNYDYNGNRFVPRAEIDVEELRLDKEDLIAENKRLERERDEAYQKAAHWQSKFNSINNLLRDKQNEIALLRSQKNDLIREKERLEQENLTLTNQYQNTMTSLQQTNTKLQNSNAEIQRFEDEIDNIPPIAVTDVRFFPTARKNKLRLRKGEYIARNIGGFTVSFKMINNLAGLNQSQNGNLYITFVDGQSGIRYTSHFTTAGGATINYTDEVSIPTSDLPKNINYDYDVSSCSSGRYMVKIYNEKISTPIYQTYVDVK